jgi:hypothetical protein
MPSNAPNGDVSVSVTYNGISGPAGSFINAAYAPVRKLEFYRAGIGGFDAAKRPIPELHRDVTSQRYL